MGQDENLDSSPVLEQKDTQQILLSEDDSDNNSQSQESTLAEPTNQNLLFQVSCTTVEAYSKLCQNSAALFKNLMGMDMKQQAQLFVLHLEELLSELTAVK